MKTIKNIAGTLMVLFFFSTLGFSQEIKLKNLSSQEASSFAVPQGAITIIAWTQIKAGSEDKVVKATRIMTDKIRSNEKGCLIFEAHQGTVAPGTIIFYEIFKDAAAFEIHKNASYVKDWFNAIEGLTTTIMNVNQVSNFDTYKN